MQIYSLAGGICNKASALAASALATNTYVSAINLHQCSAVDLNPYNHTVDGPIVFFYMALEILPGPNLLAMMLKLPEKQRKGENYFKLVSSIYNVFIIYT